MELPTKPTPKKTDLADLTILIYGRPKVGKSTFCSQAPDALFLATEPGLNSLEVYRLTIRSWAELLEACNLIATTQHRFKTIVVDTVDLAYYCCSQHVCAENKVKHPSEMKWGRGYGLINNEFQRALTKLAQLPTGLMLTSHATQIEVDERTGPYNRVIPTLPGKAREIILGMADMVLFADIEQVKVQDKQTDRRVIRTQPAKFWEAGDRTGRLPETIPLDYAQFLTAFNGAKK